MKTGPDNYYPVFLESPRSPSERWALIREFIRRWHKIELDISYDERLSALSQQKYFEQTIPLSLKEWICLAQELTQKDKFDIFRDDFSVEEIKEIAAVSLLVLAEGDIHFVMKEENLKLEDPPVSEYLFDGASSFSFYGKAADHITSFVLDHLIYYLHGAGGGCGLEIDPTDGFINLLRNSFETNLQIDHISIFERQNMVAFIMPSYTPERKNLFFEIWKEVSENEIPVCIRERLHSGGSFHGMLIPK